MDVLKHVDILEFMNINVYRDSVYQLGAFRVELIPHDKNKQVVVDPDELKQLEYAILKKCQEFKDARDPKVAQYIEEFVARMCSEWHRAGLLVIEDIPDAPSDPYARAKKNVRH